MLTIVLGAPGSGKSTIAGPLRSELINRVVIDWDELMPAAQALAGRDVRTSRHLWQPYRHLVHSVVEMVGTVPTIVLGVCTPDELTLWPEARWLLLDCDDGERRRRLSNRAAIDVEDAIADAAHYRMLALPRVDTTGSTPDDVVRRIINILEPQ